MKLVEIISNCSIPDGEGQTKVLFTGSVLALDDEHAGLVVAAGRGRYAEEGAKGKDTSKLHLAAADERALQATQPDAALAALIARGVEAALASREAAPAASSASSAA